MNAKVPPVQIDALVYALKKVLDIDIDPKSPDARIVVASHLEQILQRDETVEHLLDHVESYYQKHPEIEEEPLPIDSFKWSTDLVRPPTGYEHNLFDSPPTGSTTKAAKSNPK